VHVCTYQQRLMDFLASAFSPEFIRNSDPMN
jgi:hypothetical protein